MNINIIALGLITTLGIGVNESCANYRAGLNNITEYDYTQFLDKDNGELIGIRCYQIEAYTEGFYRIGRWIRLAHGAIIDLLFTYKIAIDNRYFWEKTGVIFLLPQIDDRYEIDEIPPNQFFITEYLNKTLDLCSIKIPNNNKFVFNEGKAGIHHVIDKALNLMTDNHLERLLIVASDSYLEPSIIEWLASNKRLKLPNDNYGLIPGEAGCAILVEKNDNRSNVLPLAQIISNSFAQYRDDDLIKTKSKGTALSGTVLKTLNSSGIKLPFQGTLISDINGELWRSQEIGNALARLGSQKIASDVEINTIANGFGETGIVAPLIAITIIIKLYFTHYKEKFVLICTSGENKEVGSLLIQNPEMVDG